MFVTRKRLDRILKQHYDSTRSLENRYWELRYKHNELLRHLGLVEVDVPAKTELRIKGGPEKGN